MLFRSAKDTNRIIVDAALIDIIVAVDTKVELAEKAKAVGQRVTGVETEMTANIIVLGNALGGNGNGVAGNRLATIYL